MIPPPFRILNGTPYALDFARLRHDALVVARGIPYPAADGIELDRWDAIALHLGVVDAVGRLAIGVRIVPWTSAFGLPLERYCNLDIAPAALPRPAELSRLAATPAGAMSARGTEIALCEALAGVAGHLGVTHWLAAMEPAFARLVRRHGMRFEAIGPGVEMGGVVRPYLAAT